MGATTKDNYAGLIVHGIILLLTFINTVLVLTVAVRVGDGPQEAQRIVSAAQEAVQQDIIEIQDSQRDINEAIRGIKDSEAAK